MPPDIRRVNDEHLRSRLRDTCPEGHASPEAGTCSRCDDLVRELDEFTTRMAERIRRKRQVEYASRLADDPAFQEETRRLEEELERGEMPPSISADEFRRRYGLPGAP